MISLARAQELARMAEAAIDRGDLEEIKALRVHAAEASTFFTSLRNRLDDFLADQGEDDDGEAEETGPAKDPAPEQKGAVRETQGA